MGRRERRYSESSSSSADSGYSDDRRHRSSKSRDKDRDKSRSRSSKPKHKHRDKDRDRGRERPPEDFDMGRDRLRTPEPAQPLYAPGGSSSKPPKIAMIILLGPEEREFRLTEAQILFDSPNDLTSTYYASAESSDSNIPPKTYRLPDRDGAIFEIIYRYLNREQVLPLRKSMCPSYLSYEQTLAKMAEEAKFYRFTKLQRALPPPGQASQHAQYASQTPVMPHSTPRQSPLPPPATHVQTLTPVVPTPVRQPTPAPLPAALTPAQAPLPLPTSDAHPQMLTLQPAPHSSRSRSNSTTSRGPSSHPVSRSHSRRSSVTETIAPPPPPPPPQHLFAYLYRPGQYGIRRGEQQFPIIDFPDDEPMPHLFLRITNAEVKFSAFRNAENTEVFELRWSLRLLDEAATRPLAYRVNDTTIKAIDSHLRLNGVIGDVSCRDIPVRLRHAVSTTPTRRRGSISDNGAVMVDDDGVFTSDLDELLDLMTSKGYVKWPRIWQDAFDNITPIESLHQRVSLTSCEVLLDLEFPEEAAQISAEVGGRGFTLDQEDEDELLVRNYRVVLHSIKCSTRKMRRLMELDNMDTDNKLSKYVSDKLSIDKYDRRAEGSGSSSGPSRPGSRERQSSRDRANGHPSSSQAMLAPPRPSYSHRHQDSTASYQSTSSAGGRSLAAPPRELPHSNRYSHASRYSSRSQPAQQPMSPWQFSDPGTARPGYAPSMRSTASEDIKSRAMANW